MAFLRRKRFSQDGLGDISLNQDPRSEGPAHKQVAKPRIKVDTKSGTVSLNARGFGFITCEDGTSYFLRANLARFLLTGDVVRFIPLTGSDEDPEARALVSVSRPASRLLCEVHVLADVVHLVSDEPCFLPLHFAEDSSVVLVPGDVVAVHVPAYEGMPVARPLVVTIARNLGPRTRPGFDLDYALVRYNFDAVMPSSFEASSVSMLEEDGWPGVSAVPFVTIDGESTRDFDDAVYGRELPQGGWEVQVAIADVSWFVEKGSQLDEWSASRCTSVYLPGRTLPMLPEQLSTDQCSLVPGKPRRAVVMTLELNAAGDVVSRRLERGFIESAARLTYTQVAGYMAGNSDVRFALNVEQSLNVLTSVYQLLSERRAEAGRLEFDEPEPTMVQAEDGTWSLRWESRNDAHKLVEELMLLANRTAASMLIDRYGAGLFRFQPPPDADAWRELQGWATSKSHALPDEPSLRAMAELVAGQVSVEAQTAASLKIRSAMRPARYVVQQSHEKGGHFSLSVDWYTHFTSPIRRYADLLVHRLLLAPAETSMSAEAWATLATQVAQCSDRAQAARMAERMVWDRLKLQNFMATNTPDDIAPARVVRANQRGLRVVLTGWQCSAWLPAAALREQGYRLVDDLWVNATPEVDRVLQEGSQVLVVWTHLSVVRPAYPELQVALWRP